MSRRIRELDTTDFIETGTFVAVDSDSQTLAEKYDLSKLLNTQTSRTEIQASHNFTVGTVLRHNGTQYVRALADVPANAGAIGIVSQVYDANTFEVVTGGFVAGLSGLTAGRVHYLNSSVSGTLTVNAPLIQKEVLFALSTTTGFIMSSGVNDTRPPTVLDITTPARSLAGNSVTTFTATIPSMRFMGASVTVSGLTPGAQLRIMFSGDATHSSPQYVGEFTPALFQDLSQGWRYRNMTEQNLLYVRAETMTATSLSGYQIRVIGEPM